MKETVYQLPDPLLERIKNYILFSHLWQYEKRKQKAENLEFDLKYLKKVETKKDCKCS